MKKNILFLHGWPNNGNMWQVYKKHYIKLGYIVHTPTLPFVYSKIKLRDIPIWIYNYINKNIIGELYALIMHDVGATFCWPLILNYPHIFKSTKIVSLSIKWEQIYPDKIYWHSFYPLLFSIIYIIYCICKPLGNYLNKQCFIACNYLPYSSYYQDQDAFTLSGNANYLYLNWIFVPFKDIFGKRTLTSINRDYLFIYSEDDKFFNSIPSNNKNEIMIKNCGHWFPLTHKKLVINLIDKYIL